MERKDVVTMKGNPVTLVGNEIKVGQPAPDCSLTANDLSEVKLSSYRGKNCIVSVVPSLDTGVCNIQTKKFNDEAAHVGPDTVILTVSMDLPFAQKRWCGAASANNITTLSDYKTAAFGEAFGVLIKELRLLARSVFVIDKSGRVQHTQIVKEVTTEPDYEAVKNAVSTLK